MDTVLAVWPCELEIRARGRKLRGSFPYNSTAVVSDRGRVRKERIRPGAFSWQLREFKNLQSQAAGEKGLNEAKAALLREEMARRNVDLLRGHNFDRPIASLLGDTLELDDTATALRFEATLPENPPSWVTDTARAVEAGLIRGVSPGFRVPPRSAVANAEELFDEPGNPGVQIRQVNQAVLYELSLVTRPAYPLSEVALRGFAFEDAVLGTEGEIPPDDGRFFRWL